MGFLTVLKYSWNIGTGTPVSEAPHHMYSPPRCDPLIFNRASGGENVKATAEDSRRKGSRDSQRT